MPLPNLNSKLTHKFGTFLLSVITLAPTIAFSGCGGGGGWSSPPPVVETTRVSEQPWAIRYTATGTLEANNKADLNTETPGNITQILVQEGQAIHRGQPLIRFKADKQMAQVQQAAAGIAVSQSNIEQQKASINQYQAMLDSAKVKLQLAKSELARYQKLYEGDFVSQLELEQKRTAFETASADYQSALQQLNAAKAQYNQALSSLAQSRSSYRYNLALAGETVVRAPFNGLVGSKYVAVGDYVLPAEKVITVVDPSSFKISFTVPEKYLHQLRIGLPVTASFEGLGYQSVTGRVVFIDPVIDMNAHTITVKALLPGKPGLKHGLLANVALQLGELPNARVIPEEAIVPQGEKTFVYVVKREIYHPKAAEGEKAKPPAKPADPTPKPIAHLQEVKVGYREAGKVQIDSGLMPGERIIISGLQKVSDNLEVNPDPPSTGSGPGQKG